MSQAVEIKINLNERDALALFWSISDELYSERTPDSSRLGMIYSEILKQLTEQGINENTRTS